MLGDPGHKEMVSVLESLSARVGLPSAILVISAHWEEDLATVTSSSAPDLIYDYSGFPPESYQIKYPCSGEPNLAESIKRCLKNSSINARLDSQRGLDHGVFVPLKIMYPLANIPCVQLSLLNTLDAKSHILLGEALKDLDYENLLVIGSGFSFHNLREFFSSHSQEANNKNKQFQDWLIKVVSDKSISEEERKKLLVQWESAPYARFCHPREEHLLPLHVCCAIAGKPCDEAFELSILNKTSAMFRWVLASH